jgi:hypothetical protein
LKSNELCNPFCVLVNEALQKLPRSVVVDIAFIIDQTLRELSDLGPIIARSTWRRRFGRTNPARQDIPGALAARWVGHRARVACSSSVIHGTSFGVRAKFTSDVGFWRGLNP